MEDRYRNNTIMDEELQLISRLKEEINKVIIGQEYMVDRILIALLTGGHILLEGVPGLAKSLTASTIARVLGIDFKRIQFTPDLLPGISWGQRYTTSIPVNLSVRRGLFSVI